MANTKKPIITKTTSKLGLPTWSITDASPTVVFVKEEIFDDILYHNMEITVYYSNFSMFEMKILNQIRSSTSFHVGKRKASLKITAGKVKDKFGEKSQTFELQVMVLHNFTDSMSDKYRKSEVDLTSFTLHNSPELKGEVSSIFLAELERTISFFQHEYKVHLRSNHNLDNALILATEQRIQLSDLELDSKNLLDSKLEGLVHQIADVLEEIRSFNNTAILRTVELSSDEIPSHFKELIESQLKQNQQQNPLDRISMVKAISALV